ncbi:MAG: head-tail adaptor protein [Deltaproteobacteria bacterium]
MVVALNRRLVLENAVRASDGAGGFVQTWQTLGTLWAQIDAGTGSEGAGQFGTVSAVPYRIVLRAAPVSSPARPRPDQRLREGPRVFRILAVTEWDRAGLYLMCFAREEVLS